VATDLDVERMREEIFDPIQSLSLSEADTKAYLTTARPRLLRSLIVEDDFISRLLLQKFLAPLGESHVAVDGEEAVLAVTAALDAGQPYQLICLDIMMPKLDGQAVLRALREHEEKHGMPLGKGAKVIMTTCLKDAQNIMEAFRGQCDVYMVKPIARAKLLEELRKLDLGTV
jgi:two-component system chemotaxis response regulator CheY